MGHEDSCPKQRPYSPRHWPRASEWKRGKAQRPPRAKYIVHALHSCVSDGAPSVSSNRSPMHVARLFRTSPWKHNGTTPQSMHTGIAEGGQLLTYFWMGNMPPI